MPQRLTPANLLLFAEAAVLIVLAAIGVRLLPFKTIGRIASLPLPQVRVPDEAVLIGRVRWAVKAAAWRSPFRALCFERGLAAQLMLRRRGLDARLHYGVAPGCAKPLEAHVWVVVEGVAVVGGETCEAFASLTVFPNK